jgi:dihydroflavonol-4-reductase
VDSLQRLFVGASVVCHLAAHISLDTAETGELQAVNVLGTRNVVAACLECGVDRLVHLSSIEALEKYRPDRQPDDNAQRASLRDHLPYSHSKAAGEMEVQRGIAAGLNAVILKPTGIIGPYDFKPSYLGRAILALARGEIPALVKGGYDWVDVRDVVAGMLLAQQQAPSGSQYVLSGHWRSVREIALQVTALTGVPAPRITVPMWMAFLGLPFMRLLAKMRKKELFYTRGSLMMLRSSQAMDSFQARLTLGFAPRPFDETIAAAVGWFDENGYL